MNAGDGGILWERRYDSTVHQKHLRNSFATPSPACDEERAYFVWSTPDEYTLVALDHDGNEKWKHDLGPYTSMHSAGPSPIVYHDLLILGNDQDGESSLLAFDRQTGKLRWQTPRQHEFVSYATPCVLAREGQPEELIFLSGAMASRALILGPARRIGNWTFLTAHLRFARIGGGADLGELRLGRGRELRFGGKPRHAGRIDPAARGVEDHRFGPLCSHDGGAWRPGVPVERQGGRIVCQCLDQPGTLEAARGG